MPRKSATTSEEKETEGSTEYVKKQDAEIDHLNRLLAAVLTYLSDDEIEEIDIDYLLNNTDGLREWWDQYREQNRKQIEQEIKKSLSVLSLEELESIREKIKEKRM
ncbi:hypothetical protein [Alkalihalobacterium alkalinitrilicum]|uniref:hypothetical protein n=1 Tax=Alkalihalobacterium alkalinitrilicum TaxID=427920 RepID=UPI000994D329|nr:hypothetical protein [Alkalihalobacterium alkalinitrilicum]